MRWRYLLCLLLGDAFPGIDDLCHQGNFGITVQAGNSSHIAIPVQETVWEIHPRTGPFIRLAKEVALSDACYPLGPG